jgi:lysyl-tRNA synthetase class 2
MASRLLPNVARTTARAGAMSLAILTVTSSAIGLLYWLRQPTASWPGPKVVNALPLDGLSGHANVPLIVFVAVLALGAIVIAIFSRALRFDGLTIALVIATGVGVWVYVASAISIFIVQQSSLDAAFVASRDLTTIYLAAALFGAAVAFSTSAQLGEHRLTPLIPSAVGLLGIIDLLAGSLPDRIEDLGPLGDLLVVPSSPVARTLDVAIGILLVICVGGLGRRNRRALWVATVLSLASLLMRVVDSVVDGLSVSATIACLVVALLLLACRGDFTFRSDPDAHPVAVLRLVSVIAGALAYSLLTFFISRTAANRPFHLSSALHATLRSLIMSTPRGDTGLSAGFGTWFPMSLRVFVALGLIWAVATWFAPWRHRFFEEASRRSLAEGVVERWGVDTLAPFTLRADKAYYFFPETPQNGPGQTTLIAYRVLRGVAIISGDPIGPLDRAHETLASFLALAAARGWQVAVIGASERLLGIYKELGLHVLYHGDEALLDTVGFSLEGGTRKSIRQAYNRVGRNGFTAEAMLAGDLGDGARAELVELEAKWLQGRPRKGFVMELDDLFRLDGDDAVFVVGRDPDGGLVGFLELAVCPASHSLSLSTMPRRDDAPNGLNAFLIVRAVEWAAANGFVSLSLNFAPGARLLDHGAELGGLQRVARVGLLIAKRLFSLQLDDLLSFNRRFAPRWQSRYLVYQRHRQLPRVVTAAMAAERYVPFPDLLRGRDWAPSGDEARITVSHSQ